MAGAWCKEPLARFCSCPRCPTHCGDTVSTAPHWIHGPTLDPWPHIGSMAPHWPLPWLQQGRCGRTQMPALMHLCRKWSFVRGTSPSQGLLRTIPALARSGLAPAVCTDLGAVSALSFPFRRALCPSLSLSCLFLPVSPIPALLVPSLFMTQKLTSNFSGPERLARVDPPRLPHSATVLAGLRLSSAPELRDACDHPGARSVLPAAVCWRRAGSGRVRDSKDRGGHPGVARAVPWGVTAPRGPGLLPAWGWVGRPFPALRAL